MGTKQSAVSAKIEPFEAACRTDCPIIQIEPIDIENSSGLGGRKRAGASHEKKWAIM